MKIEHTSYIRLREDGELPYLKLDMETAKQFLYWLSRDAAAPVQEATEELAYIRSS